MKEIAVFYVTHESKKKALELSRKLLDEKLIACSNLHNTTAIYTWDSAVQEESEVVSLLKTSPQLVKELEKRITELHPYDVPCILWKMEKANQAYADWVYKEVKS